MTVKARTKKWGNSLGVVIPAETAHRLGLHPDEDIVIEIRKQGNVLRELFGSLRFGKSTRQLLEEVRRDFESRWLK